ncbi:Uncharacterised protein [Bartonella vinsonii]|uniref:Uncharacterized protein n=1 Tax=Bartonella vinsonii TaxID=33047 RepID=A0A448V4V7_BARVI|nr:Uncharacterised protein [Bartonella vinsonii]
MDVLALGEVFFTFLERESFQDVKYLLAPAVYREL